MNIIDDTTTDQDDVLTGKTIMDIDAAANEVSENGSAGELVHITANIVEGDGDKIIYILDTGITDNNLFLIDALTGVITTKQGFDYESRNHYDITVRAVSSDQSETSTVFTVQILDVNEAPTISSSAVSPIPENEKGSIVAEITGTDVDQNDTHLYHVSDDRFEIVTINGKNILKLKDDKSIDFEAEEQIDLTVTLTDKGGLTDTVDLVVIVQDVKTVDDPNDDTDGDGIANSDDNCPETPNVDQMDTDGDGFGDSCDNDDDNDGLLDEDEADGDSDGDGLPDRKDPDSDNDGVLDGNDNCPVTYNPDQSDEDGDGIGDSCEFAPNTFSPNGDGINDYYVIPGILQFPHNKLVIVNRWGHEVYSASPYKNEWDGKMKGQNDPLPTGTYFYILKKDKNAKVEKGYIYITR
ncbi:gliding motility-associated C-terminal domain-containing protein [Marinifilum sp. D737]|uniref:T9SS type B sorting domain-containing protein n=1 Tax=Marinifilum sp. D737 TaxID=2969628 RepID=UPI003FA36ADD